MHFPFVRFLTALVLFPALAILAGCNTPTHRVRIEANVNPPPADVPPPQSFWIKSRRNDPRIETLRYHEAIGHIRTALSGRGLYQAPSEESADMVIEVDYGATPKRQRVEVEEARPVRPKDAKGAASAGAIAPTAETTEVAASDTERRGEIMIDVGVYRKHLSLEARRNRAKAEAAAGGSELLWRVEVENEDENKDLRKYVPILASATIDYIASETGGPKEVTVDENGQDVAFVKKGF